VASIIGGAICPAIMGYISDHSSISVAFIVPLICQLYISYFAVSGYKPTVAEPLTPVAAGVDAAS
jgi:FHS family L-fucose permease-like MFS transporter